MEFSDLPKVESDREVVMKLSEKALENKMQLLHRSLRNRSLDNPLGIPKKSTPLPFLAPQNTEGLVTWGCIGIFLHIGLAY